jgi:16S rRNA C967 or C1407 C5-methylase (RsmB/RsmF family)
MAVEMLHTTSGIPSFSLPIDLGILQNLPSIVCSYVLNPQPDDIVLDMCAAPGNKTTHISALMENKVTMGK